MEWMDAQEGQKLSKGWPWEQDKKAWSMGISSLVHNSEKYKYWFFGFLGLFESEVKEQKQSTEKMI